jgi:hypothetical protein
MPVYDVNYRISLNYSKSKKELKEQLLDALLCTMDSGRVRALELKSIGEPVIGKDGLYVGSKTIWEADPLIVAQPFKQASDLKSSGPKEGAMKEGTVKKYPMIEGAIKHWGIAKGLSHV